MNPPLEERRPRGRFPRVRLPAGEGGGVGGAHVSVPDWGYEGPGEPQNWGTLHPDYALCASGEQQSPIDITSYKHDDRLEVSFAYDGKATAMEQYGRFAYMPFPSGNKITVGGHSYELKTGSRSCAIRACGQWRGLRR